MKLCSFSDEDINCRSATSSIGKDHQSFRLNTDQVVAMPICFLLVLQF